MPVPSPRSTFAFLAVLVAAACGGNGAPGAAGVPGGQGGGRPPMPVDVRTLAEQPVEQTGDYVATLKSRRSTTIQPQAEGFLTRIAVRSGDAVRQGAFLFEIDSAPQQAGLAALESTRAVRAAELEYAKQEASRAQSLFAAGAVSQRELEQAETAQRTSEAALRAVDEQLRQQQAELAYFRVTAPSAGVVGDVPVRVGDRVTKSTVLTTVEENDVLEIYVNVPVSQAPALAVGLPVRIVDEDNQVLATNRITFVSPTVEPTQTVLAKAALVDGRGRFRANQFVRAQVVWRTEPGLTIPVTAVVRVNGQYFAYVVEKQGEMTVARQKAVTLGGVIGSDYVVQGGLAAGEQVITGGIQKIGDGAPVMAGGPGAPGGGAPAEKKAS
ncbi:MAG: efflux RND transporter periplasmic adaptor subunit [Acidobacteria bacterium]|nr:efflux RND transporter periplasmic adaptor subunit [Acidobacteriota bacterium]